MPSLGSGTSRSKGTFGWQRFPEARVGAAVGPFGGGESLGFNSGGVWESLGVF